MLRAALSSQLAVRSFAPRATARFRSAALQRCSFASASLKSQFEEISQTRGKDVLSMSQDKQLAFYALFKQATNGDVQGSRPGMMNMVARAKYDAWATLKGMSQESAMQKYIDDLGGAEAAPKEAPIGENRAQFFPANTGLMLPSGSFDGKVAVVTGGGTGLGRGIATALSSLGAKVVITSRKQDVLDKTADEIQKVSGNTVYTRACDVRNPDDVAAMVEHVSTNVGLPHAIVNNAAGNFIAPSERLSSNAFKTINEIVMGGTAYTTLEFGKRLIQAEQGCAFLCISTNYARTGSGFVMPSACAKAGVEALVKSLAAEWGRYGLRFNAISPGPIETKGAFSRLDPTGKFKKLMIDRLPTGRLGEVPEIANLATYLLSDYSSWVTGEIVTFDGGELPAMSGEMNALTVIKNSEWDMMEAMIRQTKGS